MKLGLNGATTMMSPGVIGRSRPSLSVHRSPRSRPISPRIASASSADSVELPSCGTGRWRSPVPTVVDWRSQPGAETSRSS